MDFLHVSEMGPGHKENEVGKRGRNVGEMKLERRSDVVIHVAGVGTVERSRSRAPRLSFLWSPLVMQNQPSFSQVTVAYYLLLYYCTWRPSSARLE
jgi:hypothetical protein